MKKTVLITGASQGIGLAIAKELTKGDYKVYGVGRKNPTYKHQNFEFIKMDLLKPKAVTSLVKKIKKLDILINNAGVAYFRLLENLREKEILEMLRLNLEIPILLTKSCISKLKKSAGHIINIGSQSSLKGEKLGTVYCASKFGIRGFSEAVFAELRNSHIKVTLVNPGLVKSTFFDDKDFEPENNKHCYVTPEDIALTIHDILEMREGSVVTAVQVTPQKNSIIKKRNTKKA